MTLRRLWKEQMGWSWMVEEFVWIILSPRERTHLHQAFTWADQLTAVVEGAEEEVVAAAVVEVEDGEILTTIEDMIEAMTDMKIMITGTEEGRLLLTTVATGHDQDPVPIAQDAIDTGAIVPRTLLLPLFGFWVSKLPMLPSPFQNKKKPGLFNLCVASCVAVCHPLLYS